MKTEQDKNGSLHPSSNISCDIRSNVSLSASLLLFSVTSSDCSSLVQYKAEQSLGVPWEVPSCCSSDQALSPTLSERLLCSARISLWDVQKVSQADRQTHADMLFSCFLLSLYLSEHSDQRECSPAVLSLALLFIPPVTDYSCFG